MADKIRRRPKNINFDQGHVETNIYNEVAGAQKNISSGPLLKPIPISAGVFSCNAVTARSGFNKGTIFWIYNNSASVQTIMFGDDNTITASGVPGATTADGRCEIACKPNEYTQLSCNEYKWIITSSAVLIVYIMEDDTFIPER